MEIIFVFLFIDLFDNIGTLVAVGKKANLFDQVGQIPRINRILFSDAIATIVGAFSGTSTVVSYIESAAGVAAGGRTGVTAIVTGLLFVLALFIAPVVGAIPAAATAPALIIVGSMMVSVVGEIAWHDPEVAIPAFLTMMTIPLTFSIANGLAFGFTAYQPAEDPARQIPRSELVRLSADRALHPALPLYVARVIAVDRFTCRMTSSAW